MDFAALEDLRIRLQETIRALVPSLRVYYDEQSGGFYHHEPKPGDFSKASTATCVAVLVESRSWEGHPWSAKGPALASALLKSEWTSAQLPKDNPFTVAFILEAVLDLRRQDADIASSAVLRRRIRRAIGILRGALDGGAVRIQNYPPNAYLTQLAVRVLVRAKAMTPRVRERVLQWTWGELKAQLALSAVASRNFDPYALAYCLIIVAMLAQQTSLTPDEKLLVDAGADTVFRSQRPDGSWQLSRPLFHYPKVGNAHCFEYEMLTQLLNQEVLWEGALRNLPVLAKAAGVLKQREYELRPGAKGWASGHHPQMRGAESWSTASVFHFALRLDRLVAEAVRRALFKHVDAPYTALRSPRRTRSEFAPLLLDSDLYFPSKCSLKRTVFDKLVSPVAKAAESVRAGGAIPKKTAMSAIFYGPPGTSKTELAGQVADYLGWPCLQIDPSHLVRSGMDQIQAEANKLFSMLAAAECVVVLLDEFDELVRDRSAKDTEAVSRFLTTAMLPKLALINKRRRIVFLLATNFIDSFDFAISRPGRFDHIIQVMPPSAKTKLASWADGKAKFQETGTAINADIERQLSALTFNEFQEAKPRLLTANSSQDLTQGLTEEFERCTLSRVIGMQIEGVEAQTWEQRCKDQRKYSR